MTFSSDLCALGTLTESTLLCCVEQRCRVDLAEVNNYILANVLVLTVCVCRAMLEEYY